MPFLLARVAYALWFTVSLYFLVVTILNIMYFRLMGRPATLKTGPRISVLIPTRNEEENIGPCLDSLLTQSYRDYEILVIDDGSTDATLAILQEYQRCHDKIRIYQGKPLPDDWYGKPHALQQLVQEARGEYFLMTDADTCHGTTSLSFCVENILYHKVDFLSGYPRHLVHTLGELLIVPMLYMMTSMILPLPLLSHLKWDNASFAIGQYIFVKKSVFEKVGGFSKIRHLVDEDVGMARLIKAAGYRTLFLDAKHQVACRMYTSYGKAFQGIGKNIFAALDKRFSQFFGVAFLVAFVIDLPFYVLLREVAIGGPNVGPLLWPVLTFFFMWALCLWDRRLPFYTPILYPLQFTHLLIIATYSMVKTGWGKGIRWKGRLVK